jgi:hypothetical protein
MRVRILGEISGTRNGQEWPKRGAVVVMPDSEGAALCASGMAERVEELPQVERATRRKRDVETR